jgi:type IV fimbrial biogenesis protein FimT
MLTTLHREKAQSAGFSLIEVMVALTVVAIAMVLGMQGIGDWLQNARVRTAAEGVKNGLQKARTEAIRTNTSTIFKLTSPGSAGGTGWTITAVRSGNTVDSKPNGGGSVGAVLTVTPSNATTVTFNGLGRRAMANADASPVLTSVTVNSALRITISAGGEIRMCNPDVSDSGDPTAC